MTLTSSHAYNGQKTNLGISGRFIPLSCFRQCFDEQKVGFYRRWTQKWAVVSDISVTHFLYSLSPFLSPSSLYVFHFFFLFPLRFLFIASFNVIVTYSIYDSCQISYCTTRKFLLHGNIHITKAAISFLNFSTLSLFNKTPRGEVSIGSAEGNFPCRYRKNLKK